MTDYKKYNDYELVSLSQEYNEEAIELLYRKYEPLIAKTSRKFYKYVQNKGMELSDLQQECTIGFEEAIKNFNQDGEVTFYTFASICMERQLLTQIKKLSRKKYQALNEAIPLETIESDECSINLIDFIKDERENPEIDLISKETIKDLIYNINRELTELEKEVLDLKIRNYGYKEISDILHKNEKSIDNTLQRIKIKINKVIDNTLYK